MLALPWARLRSLPQGVLVIYFGSAASWRPCNVVQPHQGLVPHSWRLYGSRLPNATMLHWAQQRYALVGSDVCCFFESCQVWGPFPCSPPGPSVLFALSEPYLVLSRFRPCCRCCRTQRNFGRQGAICTPQALIVQRLLKIFVAERPSFQKAGNEASTQLVFDQARRALRPSRLLWDVPIT